MKAQVCLVLFAILGFAFTQSFLDKNVLQIVSTAGQQLGAEIETVVTEVANGIPNGSVNAVLANLQPVKGQIIATLNQLKNNLTQDASFMAQVNNFTKEITPQVQPIFENFNAIADAIRAVLEGANQTLLEQLKTGGEQLMVEIKEDFSNNTDILNSLVQLYSQVLSDLKPVASDFAAGNVTMDIINSTIALVKGDISNFVANNTDFHTGMAELDGAISQTLVDNAALYSALANYTSYLSQGFAVYSTQFEMAGFVDAGIIADALAQIAALYSGVYQVVSTANSTDILSEFEEADKGVYPSVYNYSRQIFQVAQSQLVTILSALETSSLTSEVEALTTQIIQQARQTFAQDAAFLMGLKNIKATPNTQLQTAAEQVKTQVMGAINANKAAVISSVSQLVSQVANDLKPLLPQLMNKNEIQSTLESAATTVKKDVSTYVANNTQIKTAYGQIKSAIVGAFVNNSALFSGLQNYATQVANGLDQLAANLTEEDNTDASAVATSLEQSVAGFSTGFSNIAAGNGTIAGEMGKAFENAANTTGKLVQGNLKDQITTISDEVEGDVTTDNNNTNGSESKPNNVPLGAERTVMSFFVVFGALVAFFF